MNGKLSEFAGHAYAPGAAPDWWDRFTEVLGRYGLTPELFSLLLLGSALFIVAARRVSRRRKRDELSALDRALAAKAEAESRREVAANAARELRIHRFLQDDGAL